MANKKYDRQHPEVRKEQLLQTAIEVAQDKGFPNMTRDHIADMAGVSHGLVTKYFGTMANLRRTVMRAAVKQEILGIVAYGLASGNTYALKAPPCLKRRVFKHMGAE